MVVKYDYRYDCGNGHKTYYGYQCEREDFINFMKYVDKKALMWVRVTLPDGTMWFKADYVAGGRWVKLNNR